MPAFDPSGIQAQIDALRSQPNLQFPALPEFTEPDLTAEPPKGGKPSAKTGERDLPMPPAQAPAPVSQTFDETPDTAVADMPIRSDYESMGEYQQDLRAWLRSGQGAIGFQEGGITDLASDLAPDLAPPAMVDPTAIPPQQVATGINPEAIDPAAIQMVEQAAMAILGEVPPEQADAIIQAFIEQFGVEVFQVLREQVLLSVEPGAQTEGLIQGAGDGMSDEIEGTIGSQQRVAVSPGEYIVPADVVSGIGNGSSAAGANEIDKMMEDVRMQRHGTAQQPPAIDPRAMLA